MTQLLKPVKQPAPVVNATGWSLVLLAFLIPFPDKVPVAAVYLFGLCSLIEIIYAIRKAGACKELTDRFLDFGSPWVSAVLAMLPLLYLAGSLWSAEWSDCVFELEKKSLLLAFPILFFTANRDVFSRNWIERILLGFAAGTFVITVYLLISAFLTYSNTDDQSVFFYSKLSEWLHPSYLSLYVCFSLGITVFLFLFSNATKPRLRFFVTGIISLWWVGMVIILSSKAGLFSLVLTMGFMAVLAFIKWGRVSVWIFAGIAAVLLVTGILFSGQITPRLASAKNLLGSETQISPTHKADGMVIRKLSWQIAVGLWKDYPVAGTGTGDYQKLTLQRIEEKGFMFPFGGYKNAHNQYLQTAATLGLMGFLSLMLWLVVPVAYNRKFSLRLHLFFLVLVGFNLLAESMLEAQAGVMFISFFHVLLFSAGAVNKKAG